jgi:hypothetical protein
VARILQTKIYAFILKGDSVAGGKNNRKISRNYPEKVPA